MKELLYAIPCILEKTFGGWLWSQLNWYSIYVLSHSVVSKIYKKYKSSLILSLKMSLICFYLLSSFRLITLEKIIKKVYTVINKIYKHLD